DRGSGCSVFCAFTKPNVIQPTPVMVAELGDTVTLTCYCPDESVTRFIWFKQSFGQEPLHMASSLYVGQESYYSNNFIKDFTETERLGVRRGEYSCNLTISKTVPGDSATYFCSTTDIYEQTFGEGTVLFVKDSESNIMSVLQQPVSESVQPGGSVTLNCTIHTETCAGEHSVYWFRHGSGETRPIIIYTHGNWSDQCEKSPEAGSPTQSCVYNLSKRNLSLSDAGTYYCAVASCGERLFGNGTKLDIQGNSQLICKYPQNILYIHANGLPPNDPIHLSHKAIQYHHQLLITYCLMTFLSAHEYNMNSLIPFPQFQSIILHLI
uniref:Ig-like domain-containing protein n=1 Tax=Oncorhynchus mykiss TaxID=8022 RepID=A0A8K9VAB1_ONCMY